MEHNLIKVFFFFLQLITGKTALLLYIVVISGRAGYQIQPQFFIFFVESGVVME